MVGRHRQLIGKLAGEGDAKQPCRYPAGHRDRLGAEIGEGCVGEVLGDHPLEDAPGIRSGHGDLGPLIGDRDILHVELRPQRLVAELDMRHDAAGIGGGGGDEIMPGREMADGAVVEQEAVLAQHQAVARLAGLQGREAVAIEAVEQRGGIRPLEIDLAQSRDIADADRLANGHDLAGGGGAPVLARLREPGRAQPEAGLHEHRTHLLAPFMERRLAHRLIMGGAKGAGEGPEGHRRVERPEGGGADLGARSCRSPRRECRWH